MDLIDTHQHLIYRDRFGYDWARDLPPLARGVFDLDHYAELTRNKDVSGTIFMEVAVNDPEYQDEARFVAGLIGRQGLLGQIASCRPEEDAGFDPWLEECADLGVFGFRRVLHVVPDDMSEAETFRANLRKIGKAGLPFDLCLLARQLPIGVALVQACDDQPFVLDHCGVPDIAGSAFEEWAAGITAMAALPQVSVKLSGITAYCAPGTATLDLLRPWVDHVLQSFGPERMIWGGDWPVVNLGVGLPDWIDMSRALLSDLSTAEQAMIGTGNARALYLGGENF